MYLDDHVAAIGLGRVRQEHEAGWEPGDLAQDTGDTGDIRAPVRSPVDDLLLGAADPHGVEIVLGVLS